MEKIYDWNSKEISIFRSKRNVIATLSPFDNVIKINADIFPTPEIIQKMYKSRHSKAFAINDINQISYYSDLQSLNSEDAINWSLWGTLKYSPKKSQISFAKSLFNILELQNNFSNIIYWIWRRIPHPDTLVSGGPEIDFGIQTNKTLILGESKWLSNVGANQGKNKNKDQIDLRIEFLEKFGKRFWKNIDEFVILGLSQSKDITKGKNSKLVKLKEISWDEISNIQEHPYYEEFKKYLEWKKKLS